MKQNFPKIILSSVMIFSISGGIASADTTSTTSNDVKEDFVKTMKIVKEQIESGKVTTPEQVKEYQEFQSKYSKETLDELATQISKDTTESLNQEATVDLNSDMKDKKTVDVKQLENGSIAVITSETKEIEEDESGSIADNSIKPYAAITKGTAVKSYSNKQTWNIYGPHKVATLVSNTRFKLNRTSAKISSVSSDGSSSFFPATIYRLKNTHTTTAKRIVNGYAKFRYEVTQGGYNIVKKYPIMKTTINVKSNVGDKVNYTVTYKNTGI